MIESKEESLNKIIDIIKEKERIKETSSHLGLKFNPFPAAIAKYVTFPPLDDEINSKINNFISSTYTISGDDGTIGQYAGLTIVGDYGYGKTHLMRYIQWLINSLNNHVKEKIEFKAMTCFIDIPDRWIHKKLFIE